MSRNDVVRKQTGAREEERDMLERVGNTMLWMLSKLKEAV